ncbi:MAG: enoyl-CoA hydratase [Roseiflexus castenholzii]|nr:MAG: enoyl-CoA hydratase [Roseiflexus castenholzii]
MTYDNILVAVEGPLTIITINRERVRNALNQATIAEIQTALRAFEADSSQRVAIITGAGITEIRVLPGADAARRFSEAAHDLGLFMHQMAKPIIAAINGYALGGGLELAMSCDVRIAAETAMFGQPEINLGIIPGWGGTQRLPRLIGPSAARLLCMTGDMITAAEALRLGLVERVVPAASLMDEARTLAMKIASKAPLAIAAIKQAVNRGLDMPLAEGCMYEAALFGAVAATDDAKEGTSAFLEKRQPTWKGQ